MTIRVTDGEIIAKKRGLFSRGEKIVIVGAFVLLGLWLLFFSFSLASFHVCGNFTDEEKLSEAKSALMPQIAEYIERSGVRGFQDPDVQIETRSFGSIDELVAAIPSLGCYKNAETSTGRDVKGKSAKKYEIAKVCPQNGRSSVLPLNFSLVEPDSQRNSWTWKYSIYEYKDGSCRFVILVTPS